MENEILEILKRLENKIDNIEKKLDNIREDLLGMEKVITNNCYEIAKLRAKNDRLNNMKTEVDDLKSDLETTSLITAKNWKDLAEIKARNFKTDNTIENENTETLEVIKYKIQRLDDDVIDLKNKIHKNIE